MDDPVLVPTVQPKAVSQKLVASIVGIVPLNKPCGMTSFQAVARTRRILNTKKIGHAGTLDPTASGVLPLCVGGATKLVDYWHQQTKSYRCGMILGVTSTTDDQEGALRVGRKPPEDIGTIERALIPFTGKISQVPPMYSALRQDGKHLYELARAGIEVERKSREVDVVSVQIVEYTSKGDTTEIVVDVTCGKGTYMRALARDLGEALGCGGYLSWLIRTSYGSLTLQDCVTFEELEAADDPTMLMVSPAVALSHLPRIDLPTRTIQELRQGRGVWLSGILDSPPEGSCQIFDAQGTFVALGSVQGARCKALKLFNFRKLQSQ